MTKAENESVILGPHLWLNWQAMLQGHPARTVSSPEGSVQVLPLWEEYSLYSDARIAGQLTFGPYELLMDFGQPLRSSIGRPRRQLVVRVPDHLPDGDPDERPDFTPDLAGWTGGDIGDQTAALLSLALARRVRSSGVSRQCFDSIGDELGVPRGPDVAPLLGEPISGPILPAIANEVRVEEAQPFLDRYPQLSSEEAVALLRAAGQYADALWWADSDPRLSWIKLVGALETAANQYDKSTAADAVGRLKRHRGKLYGDLKKIDTRAVSVVAESLKGLLAPEAKMLTFTLQHSPGPPAVRPQIAQFDFDHLERALRTIYNWRSRDLHDGIPFPAPMCEVPIPDDNGVAFERLPFLAATSKGGTWETDAELPMYLHLFVYIVGGALRNWWTSLAN